MPFALDDDFVASWRREPPPFGFNGLGELVYLRTYSRTREEDGRQEGWSDTVARVVTGTFRMQQRHCAEQPTELVNQAAIGVSHSVQEHREPGAGRHVFSGPGRRKKHPGQPLGAELIDQLRQW